MTIEKIIHKDVNRDGTVPNGGAVETSGAVRMSAGEGCDLENCKCSEGHWIMIALPRDPWGNVEVVRVQFKDAKEFDDLMRFREVIG